MTHLTHYLLQIDLELCGPLLTGVRDGISERGFMLSQNAPPTSHGTNQPIKKDPVNPNMKTKMGL